MRLTHASEGAQGSDVVTDAASVNAITTLRTAIGALCFSVYTYLGASHNHTLALPFAVAGWLLSRGGGQR